MQKENKCKKRTNVKREQIQKKKQIQKKNKYQKKTNIKREQFTRRTHVKQKKKNKGHNATLQGQASCILHN